LLTDGAGVEVDWRERLTVHYRLISLEKEGNVCLLSECPFLEETTNLVEVAQSPAADYLCLEKACAKFEVSNPATPVLFLRCGSCSHAPIVCV